MSAAAGMVTIQATTMLPANPQRTARVRCAAPTPTMAPVIVCVVDTGIPRVDGQEQGHGAAGFGRKTTDGAQLGDFLAHGLDDAPAAEHGAERDRDVTGNDDPDRQVVRCRDTRGDQQQPDDAHGFLRVVAAVADAVGRRGGQLQRAEIPVDATRRGPEAQPGDRDHDQGAERHAEQR